MVSEFSLTGKSLGSYQILDEIGRGGMAVVYKAWQPSLERHIAVKVLPPQFTFDARFVRRFEQEAVSAARLQHPNIVTIHDVGQQDGVHYIAMAYIEGRTLDQLLQEEGPLPLERTLHMAQQIAAALDYAHGRGLVHRDIKPSNILVGPGDHVTLTDFGLVKAMAGTSLTKTGMMMGTPAYMSPEQVRGKQVGPPADIYALGVVLYRMLAGQAPFGGDTPAVLHAHAYETPQPARQINRQLPPEVDQVLHRALAKDPQQRFRSAGEMVAALSVGGLAAPASRRVRTPPPPQVDPGAVVSPVPGRAVTPPPRRRSTVWILGVAAAVAVALIGFLVWGAASGPERDQATTVSTAPTAAATGVLPTATARAESKPPTRALVSANSSPTPTWTSTRTPTRTPTLTRTPTWTATPTRTSSPTFSPTPSRTLTPTRTPTVAHTPQPTRRPTRRAPTLTKQPDAPPIQFAAPALLTPPDGHVFTHLDQVILEWQQVGQLPEDAYYAISLAYAHHGETWYDEIPWTKDTNWNLTDHAYLMDLSDDGQFRWSVQVMRKTGVNAQEKPIGVALSPMSGERTFTWRFVERSRVTVAPP